MRHPITPSGCSKLQAWWGLRSAFCPSARQNSPLARISGEDRSGDVAVHRPYGSIEELGERVLAWRDALSPDDGLPRSGLLSSPFHWLLTRERAPLSRL